MGRGTLLEEYVRLKRFLYPQKLWITLWTMSSRARHFPRQIAFLLLWSKNNQAFLPSKNNKLRRCHSAMVWVSHVMLSFDGKRLLPVHNGPKKTSSASLRNCSPRTVGR